MHWLVPAVYYSNAHIPLIAWMLLAATAAWADVTLPVEAILLACAGAFIVYQIDHSWQVTQADHINQPRRVDWVRSHQLYVWSTVCMAAVVAAIALWQSRYLITLSAAVLASIGLAYSGVRGIKRRLRIPFIKPLLITAVWVYGTVVWPLSAISGLGGQPHEQLALILLVVVRLCWIGVNVWLAEGVDQPGDAIEGIAAIPEEARGEKRLIHVTGVLAMLGIGGTLGLGLVTAQWTQVAWELLGWVTLVVIVIYAYKQRQLASPAQRWLRDVLVAWPGGAVWI